MEKNPKVIMKFKVESSIDPKEVKIGWIMHCALLDQLQLCTATSLVQNLFAAPTISFKIFYPSLHAKLGDNISTSNENNPKRNHGDRNTDRGQSNDKIPRLESRGSIINNAGNKIYFPRGMEKK